MRNETLIAARKKSGKTQAQVAKEIGITEIGYQRYEQGKRIPNAPTGNSIAKALGSDPITLFGYKISG